MVRVGRRGEVLERLVVRRVVIGGECVRCRIDPEHAVDGDVWMLRATVCEAAFKPAPGCTDCVEEIPDVTSRLGVGLALIRLPTCRAVIVVRVGVEVERTCPSSRCRWRSSGGACPG